MISRLHFTSHKHSITNIKLIVNTNILIFAAKAGLWGVVEKGLGFGKPNPCFIVPAHIAFLDFFDFGKNNIDDFFQ